MASAEQFLQLLEEKDLVSSQVLDAARREIQRTSPPPDAVGLSLWLVQGQHITASQAERLLTTVLQKGEDKSPLARWQKGEPKPTEALKSSIPVPPAPPRSESAKSPARSNPKSAPPAKGQQPAAKTSLDDLDLAPEPEPAHGAKKQSKPAAPGAASPAPKKPDASPAAPSAAQSKGGKDTATVKPESLTENLDSLDKKIGPLDSLIESEAADSSQFDDPMSGPALNAPVSKKFSLRRVIRNLFRRNKSKTVQVKAADPRHVKIVLFSWGVAVFGIIAALAAFWYFSPTDSIEIRRKAEDAVSKGDFTHAIAYYDEFLKSYGTTHDAEEIRGLRVLAELRRANQQAEKSGDWAAAVNVAQEQIKALPKSPSNELLQKVGVALAQIGEGVAKQTEAKPDFATVKLLRTMSNLIDTSIPGPARPAEMVAGISRVLKQSGEKVEGRHEIDQAITEIGSAVAADDLAKAYAAYRNVVQLYPELADSADLAAAMKQASAKQQEAVKQGDQSLTVSHEEQAADLIAAMPLAVQPVRGQLPAGKGKLQFVVHDGTAYALNALTGKVFWRRFVARDPRPSSAAAGNAPSQNNAAKNGSLQNVTALPIAGPSGGTVVLCDPFHHELLCLNGLTGALVWRIDVGQPIVAAPVLAAKSLLLLTKDQRLLFINAANGEAPHFLKFPQPIKLPPVVDAVHGLIYLVADQSNLYVIADGRCRQVLHLGHETGAIAAPPGVVGSSLLVTVNESPEEASLRLISIAASQKDEPLQKAGRLSIKGNVETPPVAMGGGAAIVTSQGALISLVASDSDGTALHLGPRLDPAIDEKLEHFALFDGKSLWVTGRQLTGYAVQAADGQIVQQAMLEQGSKFAAPPVIDAGAMYYAAERPGMPGVMVSAIDPATKEPAWQTWLAAPLVAAPMVGSITGKLTAVSASGGMFRIVPTDLRKGARPIDPIVAVETSRLSKPLSSLLALPDEKFAISSGAGTTPIAIYDPQEQERQFRWLVSPHELAAAPASYAGGVMAASVNGEVSLLDPMARADRLAKPFAISLPGVTEWKWQIPQPADDKLAVLCDGDKRVIALHITGVVPALTEAATAMSKATLVSPIAVLGKAVYVVDADDKLASFTLPDLSPGKTQALGGHAAWGPQTIGNLVLVATENNKLTAVDAQQQVVWQVDLPNGPLAGPPYRAGDEIYLASQSGIVSRIGANNGKERAKSDAGCPLGSGPLLIGGRLIVGGSDGSLLEVKKP
jgi:outer membrane protein assembly factor BamB